MKMRKGIAPQDVPLDIRLGLMIYLRYRGHWTYQEVGSLFNISRQRVHQCLTEWEREASKYVKGSWLFTMNQYNGPGLP